MIREVHVTHNLMGMCPECGRPYETRIVIECGALRIDKEKRLAWLGEHQVEKLTGMEFAILWKLALKNERVVPHWYLVTDDDGTVHSDDSIKTVIHKLRLKLGGKSMIENFRGDGYKLRT